MSVTELIRTGWKLNPFLHVDPDRIYNPLTDRGLAAGDEGYASLRAFLPVAPPLSLRQSVHPGPGALRSRWGRGPSDGGPAQPRLHAGKARRCANEYGRPRPGQ